MEEIREKIIAELRQATIEEERDLYRDLVTVHPGDGCKPIDFEPILGLCAALRKLRALVGEQEADRLWQDIRREINAE